MPTGSTFSPCGLPSRITMILATAFAVSACSRPAAPTAPLIAKIETAAIGTAPDSAQKLQAYRQQALLNAGVSPQLAEITTPSASPIVMARVTLNKSSLFNRVFLYGADLQYSSVSDPGMSLMLQSLSTGHLPVFFRLVDDRLQMLADQRHLYESDVNHPERLVHEFRVVSQDDATVTVAFERASPIIATVLSDKKAPAPRTSWLRSAEYVAEGQYMMFETSIEMPDGSIAEFMETFFPRETVVPASAKPLFATADVEPLADRYRLLDSGELWTEVPGKGRVKTKIASRFDASAEKAVDWYVTPNVPDEYLVEIQTAIEGWNRYSQKMWGKDIVHFKGKMPAGMKLGDPRYNIVNWDSIAEAGAAYESQSADPFTGIQSHSLIYLPKAWVNIGKKYWNDGGPSEADHAKTQAVRDAISRASLLGQRLPVHCIEDGTELVSLEARTSVEDFSKELLKGVLFHELGHAMGLGHNFKGSLSFDPKDPKTMFSTSIMDYNQYHLEKVSFDALDSANGPLLEYDRQIISVLYNGGKDVSETDPKLPACADDESDSVDGGVDPLCIRYDAGHDATQQFVLAIELTKNLTAVNRTQLSLPAAIHALVSDLGDASAMKSKDSAKDAASKMTKALKGVVNFYYAGGAQGLGYMAKVNVRMLRQFKEDSLPKGYDEAAMRTRAIESIRYVAGLESLEAPAVQAIETYKQAAKAWLMATPYIATLSPEQQTSEVQAMLKDLGDMPASFSKTVLFAMRVKFFSELKASEKAPFYLLENGSQSPIDFERETAQILARAISEKSPAGATRTLDERQAAAKALKTFKGTAVGDALVTQATQALQTEAQSAHTLESRSNALSVLKLLTASDE